MNIPGCVRTQGVGITSDVRPTCFISGQYPNVYKGNVALDTKHCANIITLRTRKYAKYMRNYYQTRIVLHLTINVL